MPRLRACVCTTRSAVSCRQVDGELQLRWQHVSASAASKVVPRDLEALRELAQQRGYKRGWAERVYQARLAKRHGI
jgi:hypothetical protein